MNILCDTFECLRDIEVIGASIEPCEHRAKERTKSTVAIIADTRNS